MKSAAIIFVKNQQIRNMHKLLLAVLFLISFTVKSQFQVPNSVMEQLESIDSAQQAAGRPLYRKLARRIVDAISQNW